LSHATFSHIPSPRTTEERECEIIKGFIALGYQSLRWGAAMYLYSYYDLGYSVTSMACRRCTLMGGSRPLIFRFRRSNNVCASTLNKQSNGLIGINVTRTACDLGSFTKECARRILVHARHGLVPAHACTPLLSCGRMPPVDPGGYYQVPSEVRACMGHP